MIEKKKMRCSMRRVLVMRTIATRSFTILDAMVLVAATAIGFSLLRMFLVEEMCQYRVAAKGVRGA
jgi:hypothetical protein